MATKFLLKQPFVIVLTVIVLLDRVLILMNLSRMDHFRNHRKEIFHDSEQVDMVRYAQSLWNKMLPHFAK